MGDNITTGGNLLSNRCKDYNGYNDMENKKSTKFLYSIVTMSLGAYSAISTSLLSIIFFLCLLLSVLLVFFATAPKEQFLSTEVLKET